MRRIFLSLGLIIIVFACSSPLTQKDLKSPDVEFGELFREVQQKNVFPDSRTFADCTPNADASIILKAYNEQKTEPNFNLKQFVSDNFTLPQGFENSYKPNPNTLPLQYVNDLWATLIRKPEGGGTLIRLRKSHPFAGLGEREMYYSDSYFAMLGLETITKDSVIENMVINFAQLIQDFGHIPSGNRSYYLSRSQPPFFAMMVKLLTDLKKDKNVLIQAIPQIQKEYYYWMAIEDEDKRKLTEEARKRGAKAHQKLVFLAKDATLNRYFDETQTPRAEVYREDVATAKKSGRKPESVYQDLRAGAESGWDFSSRWLRDGKSIETIHTTEIAPIDLNALLYQYEMILSEGYAATNSPAYAKSFLELANKRKELIDKYLWNESAGFYFDYDFVAGKQKEVYSLAGVYPLFFKMATPQQAEKVAKVIEVKFLQNGGLMTTLNSTGLKYDGANGFAAFHWVVIQGLRNYGFDDLANTIKVNWINTNLETYKKTGKTFEYYNVVEPSKIESRREGYTTTNSVLARLLSEE
ncbi:MAG: trehalase [Spirosomaceae bacterium]|jgi:alpha,alpha-trehalase|nr:trehalase [Spirosomataceae bacterium]